MSNFIGIIIYLFVYCCLYRWIYKISVVKRPTCIQYFAFGFCFWLPVLHRCYSGGNVWKIWYIGSCVV